MADKEQEQQTIQDSPENNESQTVTSAEPATEENLAQKTTDSQSTASNEEDSSEDENADEDDDSIEVLTEPSISEAEFIEVRKDVRDLGKRKEWLFETRSIVSQQIKELFQSLKEKKEQRDVLTNKVKSLKDERENLNSEIKESIGKIKTVSGDDSERVPIGKIKKELESLQYKVETTPLSPDEEKKRKISRH